MGYNNGEEIFRKWGIIQIRTVVKNGGIVQIGVKCSENEINSKWWILQKMWGNFHMGDSGFQNWGF